MTYDPKWEEQSYFDGPFNYDNLRHVQRMVGPEMIRQCADLFIADNRKKLLSSVSLFVLTCGAGKTLLMVAVLFAICEEVSHRLKNAPRPRRVLWFCDKRSTCVQLQHELETEIAKYHLADPPEHVQICDKTGDLDRPPRHHVITISCPHALWGSTRQKRSDERIMEILAEYDTIIWDECDFARDQIERLVRLSPHALKFGLTASPLDADGNFLRDFYVLAGVASYQDVLANDHCLKPMLAWKDAVAGGYVKPITHDGFSRFDRGIEKHSAGQHGERHSLPGSMAAIRKAIDDCYTLEEQMRQAWPDDWYSPHILVITNTIEECCDLCVQTNNELERLGYSQENGWRAAAIVSPETKGEQRLFKPKSKAEEHLFHKNPELVHPFMVAKDRDGRCDRLSARILFGVDIPVRAMNCWPLLFVVDLKRSGSVAEQVQTVGRPSRLPPELFKDDDPKFVHFTHPRWYFPDAGQESANAIEKAWTFIHEMEERVEAAGFLQWSDLLEGKSRDQLELPQGLEAPFTLTDRLQIDHELGTLKAAGTPIDDLAIERIIEAMPGTHTMERRERAREHIINVLHNREYRESAVRPVIEIIKPVSREEPKAADAYSTEELTAFIINAGLPTKHIEQLNIPMTREIVAEFKRREDQRLYRPVQKIRQLHEEDGKPGIITALRNTYFNDLRERGLIDYSAMGEVSKAINLAVAKIAGMDDSCTYNDGPLDRPGYHYILASVPSVKRRIKELASSYLIVWGVIGNTAALYDDVLPVTDAAQ